MINLRKNPLSKLVGGAMGAATTGAQLATGTAHVVADKVRGLTGHGSQPAPETPATKDDQPTSSSAAVKVSKTAKVSHTAKAPSAPISTTPREVPKPKPPKTPSVLDEEPGVVTPFGTTGATPAYNPSTAEADPNQPGTEDIVEPSTVKAVKSEYDMMRKAADPHK